MNILKSVSTERRFGGWRLRRSNWLAVAGFAIVTVVLCTASLWLGRKDAAPLAAQSLSHRAFDDQVKSMATLLRTEGPDSLFAYVNRQVASDPSFARDCHPLLHTMGKQAYGQYGGFAGAMKWQNESCNSGFTHGIIEAYYADVPDIRQAVITTCPADASQDFRQWQCYHGIGHGVMLAEKRNVTRSVEVCGQLPAGFAADACVNGVYMEKFIVIDHSGQIRPGYEASFSQCQQASFQYRRDCYYYAPTAYIALNPNNYRQAYEQCLDQAKGFRVQCVNGIGGQIMKDNITNPTIVRQQCEAFNDLYGKVCIEGAVAIYINHYASTSIARPLCNNEFNDYRAVCEHIIAAKKQRFNI